MWRRTYNKQYKTSNPNLLITSVCSFPNLHDTLEKVIEYYQVKQLQKDQKLLNIYSDFWFNNGNKYIPIAFEDDVPKLKKLQKLMPVEKSFFWCICYQSPFYDKKGHKYNSPSYEWYKTHLKYWFELGRHAYGSSITQFLFTHAIKTFLYETSPGNSQEFTSRRFDLIENKRLIFDYTESTQEYLDYLEDMEKTDWYKFIFHAFK